MTSVGQGLLLPMTSNCMLPAVQLFFIFIIYLFKSDHGGPYQTEATTLKTTLQNYRYYQLDKIYQK